MVVLQKGQSVAKVKLNRTNLSISRNALQNTTLGESNEQEFMGINK